MARADEAARAGDDGGRDGALSERGALELVALRVELAAESVSERCSLVSAESVNGPCPVYPLRGMDGTESALM